MLSYLWVEPVSLPYVFHCIPISAVICANLPNGIHSAYIPESYSDLGLGRVEDLPIHVGSFPMAFTTYSHTVPVFVTILFLRVRAVSPKLNLSSTPWTRRASGFSVRPTVSFPLPRAPGTCISWRRLLSFCHCYFS